jgi:hypothetical protein
MPPRERRRLIEDMTVALTAELEGPAIERLRELQSHRP